MWTKSQWQRTVAKCAVRCAAEATRHEPREAPRYVRPAASPGRRYAPITILCRPRLYRRRKRVGTGANHATQIPIVCNRTSGEKDARREVVEPDVLHRDRDVVLVGQRVRHALHERVLREQPLRHPVERGLMSARQRAAGGVRRRRTDLDAGALVGGEDVERDGPRLLRGNVTWRPVSWVWTEGDSLLPSQMSPVPELCKFRSSFFSS